MSPRTVTLELPGLLYEQIEQRAAEAHRSVEAELLDVVATAVPASDELSPELADVVPSLTVLGDDDLRRAAESHLSGSLATRLEELNAKRRATGLDGLETEELSRLLHLYERTLLVRASAAKMLKDRGLDLPPLRHGGLPSTR
jgi:plasmid stability protein